MNGQNALVQLCLCVAVVCSVGWYSAGVQTVGSEEAARTVGACETCPYQTCEISSTDCPGPCSADTYLGQKNTTRTTSPDDNNYKIENTGGNCGAQSGTTLCQYYYSQRCSSEGC